MGPLPGRYYLPKTTLSLKMYMPRPIRKKGMKYLE